jgi:hypothetical protein
MTTKSQESIYGSSIRASAERALEARKEADRLACIAWHQCMLGFRGPAQPSPTLGDALNAGYLYLEVRCLGCDTHQTVALNIVRRPKSTSIHELERYIRKLIVSSREATDDRHDLALVSGYFKLARISSAGRGKHASASQLFSRVCRRIHWAEYRQYHDGNGQLVHCSALGRRLWQCFVHTCWQRGFSVLDRATWRRECPADRADTECGRPAPERPHLEHVS